eukprot:4445639-Prorocentrum_lima.AAC.1
MSSIELKRCLEEDVCQKPRSRSASPGASLSWDHVDQQHKCHSMCRQGWDVVELLPMEVE